MRKITSAIKREIFSTRINPDLVKQLKHLAVDGGRPLCSRGALGRRKRSDGWSEGNANSIRYEHFHL